MSVAGFLTPIERAPSFRDLLERSSDRGGYKGEVIPDGLPAIEDLMAEEALKRYRAKDVHGNIYEVQNPAVMTFQTWKHATEIQGVEKKLLGQAEEAAPKRKRTKPQLVAEVF
jgi:hypothetical protein